MKKQDMVITIKKELELKLNALVTLRSNVEKTCGTKDFDITSHRLYTGMAKASEANFLAWRLEIITIEEYDNNVDKIYK